MARGTAGGDPTLAEARILPTEFDTGMHSCAEKRASRCVIAPESSDGFGAAVSISLRFSIERRASVTAESAKNAVLGQGTLTVEKRDDNEYYVEFRNVSFKYPDAEEYILENISFKAEKG